MKIRFIVGGAELFTDLSTGNAITDRIKELERLSFLDNLTQLANRRFVEMELDSRISELNRYGVAFGVVFMDIDHFKRFNDTYGHDVGDRVLQTVARTFINTARPSDLMGRWGGEEFLIALTDTDLAGARIAAEKFRLAVELGGAPEDSVVETVTVTIGLSVYTPERELEAVIQEADNRLYQGKEAGRNRVIG